MDYKGQYSALSHWIGMAGTMVRQLTRGLPVRRKVWHYSCQLQKRSMTTIPDRFSDLWLRRGSLSEPDMVELYKGVSALLRPIAPGLCTLLPDTPENYVQEFVIRHLLEVGPKSAGKFQYQSEIKTQAFIKEGFRFFVLDIRKSKSLSDSDVEHVDDDDLENVVPADQSTKNIPSVVETLAARGITLEQAETSAKVFSSGLPHDEKLLLFYHTCMDYDDKNAERKYGKAALPLTQFKHVYGMKNCYRKARSLGITGKSGGYVADYHKTEIGRWMVACGLKIDADHWDEMRSLLIVLCGVIFNSFEEMATP